MAHTSLADVLGLLALLSLTSVVSPLSQLSSTPTFGALPAAYAHDRTTLTLTFVSGCLLAAFLPHYGSTVSKIRTSWAFWIPLLQHLLSRFNSQLGPSHGAVAHAVVGCYVLVFLCAYSITSTARRLTGRGKPRFAFTLLILALSLVSFSLTGHLAASPVHALAATLDVLPIHLLSAAVHSLLGPRPDSLLILPALVHTLRVNPRSSQSRLNAALAPHNWTVLDRAWSNTGYISVLESHNLDYRLLRCDHSLLGGQWLLTEERKREGWVVPEPTYAVFSMLEAVRLVERPHSVPDVEARALVIGLGVGSAPSALIQHGIHTTIVELDPAVHRFATTYFGLPGNHTAVLADAVDSVSTPSRNAEEKYDYIIHDVFTGGAEPLPLFTTSFLTRLKGWLKDDGVVAINYAGDLSLPLTKHVLRTIEGVFDGWRRCRVFRDAPPAASEQESSQDEDGVEGDFLNLVIFCRNSGPTSINTSDGEALTFRRPVPTDYLSSRSRRQFLLPRTEHEIAFPLPSLPEEETAGLLEEGDLERWNGAQRESVTRHWRIMRGAVPDVVWDLW